MNNLGVMKKKLIVDGATFAEEHSIKTSEEPQGIFVSQRKATLFHSRNFYSSTSH